MRTAFTLAAREPKYSDVMRLLALVPTYRWLGGKETGTWGAFGGPVWWADSREMRGWMWLAYVLLGDWRILAADTLTGGVNWVQSVSNGKRLSSSD